NREMLPIKQKRAPLAAVSRREREARVTVERLVKIRPPKNRRVAEVKRRVGKNDPVFWIDPHRLCHDAKIRFRRIARGKKRAARLERVAAERTDIIGGKFKRIKFAAEVRRVELFGFEIVNGTLADKKLPGARLSAPRRRPAGLRRRISINAHVAAHEHV